MASVLNSEYFQNHRYANDSYDLSESSVPKRWTADGIRTISNYRGFRKLLQGRGSFWICALSFKSNIDYEFVIAFCAAVSLNVSAFVMSYSVFDNRINSLASVTKTDLCVSRRDY